MVKGIINKGYYSRIGRGLENISTDTLFRIILKHHIDISDSFNRMKDNYYTLEDKRAEEPKQKIMYTFNNDQREELRIYLSEILDLEEYQIFKHRTVITIASLENNLAGLSPSFKDKIVTKFSEHENQFESVEALRLFSDYVKISTLEQLGYLLGQLLKHHQKHTYSESMQEGIAIICNNYLCYRYKQKIVRSSIQNALSCLRNLESIGHFLPCKVCYDLYFYLFEGGTERADKIKELLINCGYQGYVEQWQAWLCLAQLVR